ncbi:B12-binding domain-containing radical SAM protein [Rugamonas sp. CCM 8940]|uniref:B12-binding domain-containing radical SAM protein n=1 Tax=Rugamonas sp. CCM 8940 TaxID=2765359 RepID=UPI0018F4945D|nr:radical SAM protein [Rugamonas sp. CCM 8940]MBJ7313502.1 radical SAM protein [Rugamonas sp. CCM 8940]
MMRNVVITSPVQPIGGVSPDIYSWDKSSKGMRMIMSFLHHPALAFLEANLPVKVLHYPTWEDFCKSLNPLPDVLGISFYINETEQALAMARHARKLGVKEIWAGNFGSYTPEIVSEFDHVVQGWGEAKLAQIMGLEPDVNTKLIHPEIYGVVGTNLFPRMLFSGTLFTSRSCPFTCNFCQTPDFYGRATMVPLEEIERIVWTYKKRGVSGINILDENFGTFKQHAQEVVKILHKNNLRWVALTRVDTLRKNFEFWHEHGMFGAHLGIESLNDRSLSGASKRTDQHNNLDMLKLLGKHNMFAQIFYILGFEEDTPESIKEDIQLLAEQDFDVAQIQVLTPYPRTEQRRLIEQKYGIFEFDLRKYNSRNLVWNHPNISPVQMKELQEWANNLICTQKRVRRSMSKLGLYHGRARMGLEGISMLMKQFGGEHGKLHREYQVKLAATRQWAKSGWFAYEEQQASNTLSLSSAMETTSKLLRSATIPIKVQQ